MFEAERIFGKDLKVYPDGPCARKLNINERVLVKLTDEGIEILKKSHEDSQETIKSLGEFEPPKPDSLGYVGFQLWDLMATFGEYMHNGCSVPFETEILI